MSAPPVCGALVLLDTDIIYPIQLCDFFLTAAETGLIPKPVVRDTILAEARRNLLADRPTNVTRSTVASPTFAASSTARPFPSRLGDTTLNS